MKKIFFVPAVITLIFASCSENNLRSDIQEEQIEIGFSTYADKLTRADNSNATVKTHLLETYNTTFTVWGYKYVKGTSENMVETPVIGAVKGTNDYTYPGQMVEHITASGDVAEHWDYTPKRFWDKSATSYSFFAAAPHRTDWSWNTTTKKVSLNDFSITGYNSVTETPATSVASAKVLTSNLDTEDLMIATDVTGHKTFTNAAVVLDFNHILSRLNIGVRKSADLDEYTVLLKTIKVYNMKSNGSFNEGTVLNTSNEDLNGDNVKDEKDEAILLSQGTVKRWLDAETPATFTAGIGYTNTDGLEITSTAKTESTNYQYVYEGLAIPQTVAYSKTVLVNEDVSSLTTPYIKLDGSNAKSEGGDDDSEPYIVIEYEIGETDASNNNAYTKIDSYKYYYNLADVFNGDNSSEPIDFCEGWQNTLKITLAPAAINFDADVYEWATKQNTPVNVD